MGLTTEQLAAVNSEGGALLVSAAAGSGKTRVLVERLMRKLRSGDDIDDFLIITYTNAAASELRGKILDALYSEIAERPDSVRLHRQINLCSRAHIETIHGFCLWLIRKNVNRLGLTPDVRVADDGECNIIKRDVLERLLEERYASGDSGFLALADTMGAGRDDSRLVDITLQTHGKLLSHPDPEGWVRSQLAALELDGAADISDTIWGKLTLERIRDDVSQICAELERLVDSDDAVYKAYGASVEKTVEDAEAFCEACGTGWDAARAVNVVFPRAKPLKGYDSVKEKRRKYNIALKDLLAELQEPSEKLLDDMRAVAPVIRAELSLVLDFDKRYSEMKRSRGILDFSDQEHFALELLRDKTIAGETAELFKEILIDEYQDVNSIQEEIFTSLAVRGSVFMVGDVKQSIYRFRLAEPEIFLKKYSAYKDHADAADGEPRKVVLSKNFRSRAEILDACNFVFKNIMSSELGDIDYTEREFLYAGRDDFGDPPEPPVELDIIDAPKADKSQDEDAPELDELEARYAAKRVLELVGSFPLENGKRTATFGDVAVLMRSPRNRIGTWLSVFNEYGIPTAVEEKQSFFDEPEVSLVLSLLAVIDNPRQDAALVSVLRSPLFGFTPDELAAIRAAERDGDFYTALLTRADSDAHCADFLARLDRLRDMAPEMSADKLLWHIYSDMNLFAIVGDETRKRSLMDLLTLAAGCEKSGFKGLFGFESYVRRLIETGRTPEQSGGSGEDNAVRFMSIHKSKGLEFPIVILANLTKGFNRQDSTEPLLIHPQLGFGPKVTHLDRKISYSTIARRAIRDRLNHEMMSEEMRILYVAMTRASEKLIMLVSFRDADTQLAKLSGSDLPVLPLALKGARSHAAWILYAALRRAESRDVFEGNIGANIEDGNRWLIRVIKQIGTADNIKENIQKETSAPERDGAGISALREKLEYVYPYGKSAALSSKLTATELKGSFREEEAAEEASSIIADDTVIEPPTRPAFMDGRRGLTAARKGTATHIVMQYADYGKCRTVDGVRGEIEKLRLMRNLTDEEAAAVDPFVIRRFFDTRPGRLLLNAEKVWRELKFSILVGSEELNMEGGEKLLLQGVVDCCVLSGDKLIIIDFKTDYVNDGNIDERVEFYRGQLDAYALAMKKILKRDVEAKLLCFLTANMWREL